MQHSLTRSGAIAAITALSIGAGATVATTAASAASTTVAPAAPADARLLGLGSLPILGPVLTPILEQVVTPVLPPELATTLEELPVLDLGTILANASPTQLTTILDGLSLDALSEALGVLELPVLGDVLDTALGQTDGLNLVANLLTGASGGDLTALLSALDPGALDEIVNTMFAGTLAGLLGGASGTDLTALVGTLDPAKITELLALGGGDVPLASLLGGLTGVLSGAGAAGGADALVGPLAQLQALLAGLPLGTDLLQLDGLLGTVTGLLGTAGLADLPIVGSLLETVSRVQATSGGTSPALTTLSTTLATLLGSRPTAPAPSPTTPATTAKPAIALPGVKAPAAGGGAAASTAYRATFGQTVIAKNRRTTTFTVKCPTAAPKGCVVKVSATLAGKKVLKPTWIAVLRGKSAKVKVQLPRTATSRLAKKGGTITFRAATATSTRGAVTKTLKVKKPAKKKAAAKKRR